jgi:hypothetical protein
MLPLPLSPLLLLLPPSVQACLVPGELTLLLPNRTAQASAMSAKSDDEKADLM